MVVSPTEKEGTPMKLGQKMLTETLELVASPDELQRGEVWLRHPRCGRVIIKLTRDGWVVTSIEKEDTP